MYLYKYKYIIYKNIYNFGEGVGTGTYMEM